MMGRRVLAAGLLLVAAGLSALLLLAKRNESHGQTVLADVSGHTRTAGLAAAQPEESFEQTLLDAMVGESWFQVNALGQTVGYAYMSTQVDRDEEKPLLKTVNETFMTVQQGGQACESKSVLTIYHNTNFVPIRFLFTSDLFGLQQHVEAVLRGRRLYVTSTTGGQNRQVELPVSDAFGSEVEITRAALEGRLKPGTRFEFQTYNPATGSLDEVTVTVGELDTVQLPDGPVKAWILEIFSSALGVTSTEWIAEPADVVKVAFPVLGAAMVKVTEKEALEGFSPLKISDHIPVDFAVSNVKQVRSMVLDVTTPTDDIADLIPEDARQRFIRHQQHGTGTLQVRSVEPAPGATSTLPVTGNGLSGYLQSTEYLQPDDPQIIAAAKEAIGGEQNAWAAAKKLVHWVYRTIELKDREPAPVTSKHVLEARAGDCTEHTVLYAALGRAVGLPTKFCAGIAMSEGAFYYHAWPEVYVGQAGWIAVDPTWDETVVDATHIKLGEGPLNQQSFARICLAAGRTMGNLEVTVREYGLADGTIRRHP